MHAVPVWKYAYTFRRNPDRHCFSTGWTTFVHEKKLVAGDSVVLMKNSAGQIYVGFRRHKKEEGQEGGWKRVKLTPSEVLKAAELAESKTEFEVVYYPSPNWFDFVVDAKVVDDAMKIVWKSGIGVKLALNTEESSNSKMKNVQPQGTISNVSNASSNAPNWRILQVNWDESGSSQNPNLINPWQVELYDIYLHRQFDSPQENVLERISNSVKISFSRQNIPYANSSYLEKI